ncbi:PREDICTED: transcriptional protein SWT1-like [Vollenhovia emeryi]|uniref:transcriptional protein SWT1-like n=1 Tax=Vollenhovia emeryi TaxID=411798 RepID=UPI0005F398D6|nr:PREDICTED: transcriptional protein SWT1-like [Vollenhovia emeryi]
MFKRKLPKDWIAVTSKSHPDRVYYFNVRTNKSSWIQPTMDKADKTPSANRYKVHKEKHRGATTPEDNAFRQCPCDRLVETPQMKALRAKMQQRLDAKNASASSSKASHATTVEHKKQSFSSRRRSFSPKSRDDKSVTSRDQNDNKVTCTPQMRVLYTKIEQRISRASLSKVTKDDTRNTQQDRNVTSQRLQRTWEKRERNAGHQESIIRNKRDISQHDKNQNVQESHSQNVPGERQRKAVLRKNLAKDCMQRIRRNLSIDKERFKEMCHSDLLTKKTSQKFSGCLPTSSDNDNLESTRVHKSVDNARLKRLHNRVLKEGVYKRNATLSDSKSQSNVQQKGNAPVTQNMTRDKLIEQTAQEVLYEEMDWEPMKDEEIALEVEVVRAQIDKDTRVEINYMSENIVELTQPNEIESHEKSPLYIVVDTNVFLSNLEVIERARDTTFKNYPRPFIVIPWTVICELDYFKDNKSKHELSAKARQAISFIHDQFSSKHPRVIGQTREQATKNKEDFSLNCPDDEILQCCLQIQQLKKSVVLLSYDKNLCTKTMIYNILALGRHDPLEKIENFESENKIINPLNGDSVENSVFHEELRLTDDVFEDIKLIMKNFLSAIIVKQMSQIFGEAEWKIYVIIKPPWTTVTALKCAIKHWIAAINESFERRAEYLLKELLEAFVHIPVGGRKLQDVEYIIEKSSTLVQIADVNKYRDLTAKTFNAITELKEKCKRYITDINLKKLHNKIGIANNAEEQETRAGKVFQCFQYIYNYARDICGLACNNAGMAYSFAFETPANPALSQVFIQRLQSEITKKVIDLTQNLNELLAQAEDVMKYQTLLSLQQNLNTFLPDTPTITFDVTPLDIYYCVKLKEEALKTGLRQLQELTSHFCALAAHI